MYGNQPPLPCAATNWAPRTAHEATTAIANGMERVQAITAELHDTAARVIARFEDVVVPFPVAGSEPSPAEAPRPMASSMAIRLSDVEQMLARINSNLNGLISACEL